MEIEIVAKYAWIGLLVVLAIALLAVVISPRFETRSVCTGFQYFVFLDQKASENSYTIQVLNGVNDAKIMAIVVDGSDTAVNQEVKAGDTFQASVASRGRQNETFSYRVSIDYDTTSIEDRLDTATCTGRIE